MENTQTASKKPKLKLQHQKNYIKKNLVKHLN